MMRNEQQRRLQAEMALDGILLLVPTSVFMTTSLIVAGMF